MSVPTDVRFTEVFGAIVDLAAALRVTRINQLPGCWEHAIDELWWLALNGHRTPVRCSRGVVVEPFHAYVEWNGWPAGVLSPDGGLLAAGALANEDALIEALRKAARQA